MGKDEDTDSHVADNRKQIATPKKKVEKTRISI